MQRLEQIESELKSLGSGRALSDALPELRPAAGLPGVEDQPMDLEAWSTTVTAAVLKAVWSNPLDRDLGEQLRRSSRARELRELATPIEFDAPARPRPEPETKKPPSWAWAAGRRIS